ncbi:ABC transporter ATP-binding protein [Parafrankia elaeagni]|uniref:ABC transporter ATP-binding protein n=1 Tax=Parafrankia elaeagni TaxID=222534 RepID=UPI000361F11B|nr:ABC transporter ATP-binding protein [Parafrankia elaeagni]
MKPQPQTQSASASAPQPQPQPDVRPARLPALDIRGARFAYGRRTVLADLDLTVDRGTVVGLLGPNGSGKSTLIRGICRIHRPKAGTFRLGDIDLHRLAPRELARTAAYVPQGSPGPFSLTVTEAVMLGRTPHVRLRPSRADERHVREAMELLDLTALGDRHVDELSGGQAQRVVIARALAQQPEVLLLDEPTSALDLRHQVETLHLVHTLAVERDLYVLMAIHDLNLAARFCHRVALLHGGRIVTAGTPAGVYRADLLEQVYGLPVEVDVRDGVPEVRPRLPTRRAAP